MALQNLVGQGVWLPTIYQGFNDGTGINTGSDETLDAEGEELQAIVRVVIDGGGSKTFGTSGSTLQWNAGASNTFQSSATLRVGVKSSAVIDAAAGPAARATIGAAAFSVYKDLIGGTDTITNSSWRSESMAAGTPFTVTHGDLLAICLHLDIVSAAQSVRPKMAFFGTAYTGFPVMTLVTSGPTYALRPVAPNFILTFDDGTLGWLDLSYPCFGGDGSSGTIGNGNIYGNIFRVPYACQIDAIAAIVNATTNAANFELQLYSTPLGTPALIESVAFDANTTAAVGVVRLYIASLTTPRTLAINTDYAVGVKQTTATSVTNVTGDVNAAAHFKARGMGAECYAALSTAGATFVAQNSGKRRASIYVRLGALSDDVSAGGGGGRPEFRGSNL